MVGFSTVLEQGKETDDANITRQYRRLVEKALLLNKMMSQK